MANDVSVEVKGPLFDLRREGIVKRGTEQAVRDVSKAAYEYITSNLQNALVNPTGFYQARIGLHQKDRETAEVADGGVVYGPWLEAGGLRGGAKRFKGYRSFRRATQKLKREIKRLAEPVVDKMVREFN